MNSINILYLVNDMYTNNFEYLLKLTKNDRRFNLTIVTCDSLATEYKDLVSSKHLFNYLKNKGIKCIDGFDYKTKKWKDLSRFKPDYIFVSNPYDIYRPGEYNSSNLSMLAKLCHIEYGAIIINDDNRFILSNDFYYNASFIFISSPKEMTCSKELINNKKIFEKFIPVGCLKLDKYLYDNYRGNWNTLFKSSNDSDLRICWKPRWYVEDTNKFFNNLTQMIEYSKKNHIQILLIEHPLFKSSLKAKKMLDKYSNLIKAANNNFICYDGDDFLDYCLEADMLIGGTTSLMAEFSITNKPIILEGKYDELNDFGKSLIKKNNAIENFDYIDKQFKKYKHKKSNFKNGKLFKPLKKMSGTEYMLDILEKDFQNIQKYYFDEYKILRNELNNIQKILEQGYNQHILDQQVYNIKKISNGIDYWQKTIEELRRKK